MPMMFLGLRKLGNICCEYKMFLNKIRNIFSVKFVSATNVARAGERANLCVGNNAVSATMSPSSFARALTEGSFDTTQVLLSSQIGNDFKKL